MRFRSSDIFLPEGELSSIEVDGHIEGIVVDFSDSRSALRYFAVIDVTIHRGVVMPINKLERVPTETAQRAEVIDGLERFK